MSLVPVDTSSALTVTDYLTCARDWLATAVEMTGPEQIAAAKAEIATAAEATKQFHLSKECQLDAEELVRRAEYALGKAIRKGQAEGAIATTAEMASFAGRVSAAQRLGLTKPLAEKPKPSDFASESELMGARRDGIYAISDGVEESVFDAALDQAKSEGNLSRANVVRKVKQSGPTTRDDRADLIAELAAQGYSSRQMPAKVGVTEESVRDIARAYSIEIPGDKAVSRTRRIDSTQVAANTVTALEGLVMGVELIDYDAIDPAQASQWADSLSHSLRVLNRFHKQIKETTQ